MRAAPPGHACPPARLPPLPPRRPPTDAFTLVWETKVLLHLNSALGKLLTMQAAGQSLQLATHSFFYAGAGGQAEGSAWLQQAAAARIASTTKQAQAKL